MGFLAANKIGPMKTDMDVDVTFEGDNTVMMQQVRLLGLLSSFCDLAGHLIVTTAMAVSTGKS
jgi:acyl-CoA oxidase